jgi:HlyD family secretion protein
MFTPSARRPLIVVASTVAAALAALAGWVLLGERRAAAPEAIIELAADRVVQASVLAPATLVFSRSASLRSELLAKVASIEVKEGDDVKQGAVLMRLDPQTPTAVLAREEAGLRQNQISIDRQRNLVALRKQTLERSLALQGSRLINQSRVDEDRSQLLLAEADLRSAEQALERALASVSEAREQLGRTLITAPLDGKVISIPIAVGEVAVPSMSSMAGATLAKIVDPRSLRAIASIDERDVGKIAIGQHAAVAVASNPSTPLDATVTDIAFEVAQQSRSFGAGSNSIEVMLDVRQDPAVLIRSGISARATIFTGSSRRQVAVPVQAVIAAHRSRTVTDSFVWVVEDGRARKRIIGVGDSDSRYQAIKSGLKGGEAVIVGPARLLDRLQEGQPVRGQTTRPPGP